LNQYDLPVDDVVEGLSADLTARDRAAAHPKRLFRMRSMIARFADRRPGIVGAGLAMLLCLPLVIAALKALSPRWYPGLDWAWTEIRVRDVATSHPPLIGLAGRIGPFGANSGSHPGPVSFYLLFPAWKILGGSANALVAANVVIDIAAISLSLWLAFRRGGVRIMLAIAATLAVLMHAYGIVVLTLPWNPHLPVLWWFLFVVGLWSLLDDDIVALPVAAFAGTLCAQTHISYLGLVFGLAVLTAAVVVWRVVKRRHTSVSRHELLLYGSVATAIVALCWAPPMIDELAHRPGNLTTIRQSFTGPSQRHSIGLSRGVNVVLARLNPVELLHPIARSGLVTGSTLPGFVFLVAWVISVVFAWRLRVQKLLMLNLVVGAATLFCTLSAARIVGPVLWYLVLWMWTIDVLMLLAIAWTAVEYLQAYGRDMREITVGVSIGVLIVATAALTVSVSSFRLDSRLNRQMAALFPPTVAALQQLERSGQHGPYLVTFLPALQNLGGEGYGLLDELLRHGFDARMRFVDRSAATRYHVLSKPSDAAIQIHVATGPDIAYWRADPRFHEIAYNDPLTDAQHAALQRLQAAVITGLERAGLHNLKVQVDTNLAKLATRRGLPSRVREDIRKMMQLTQDALPVAIYIGPIGNPLRDPFD
jgi:hypothetical protein